MIMVNRPFRDGCPVHKDTATESQWLYLNLSVSPPGPHSWPLWCMSTHPSGRKKSPRHALLSWNQKTTPLQDGKEEGWDSKAGLCVALLLYEWGCNSRQNVPEMGFAKWITKHQVGMASFVHTMPSDHPNKDPPLIQPILSVPVISTGWRFASKYIFKLYLFNSFTCWNKQALLRFCENSFK